MISRRTMTKLASAAITLGVLTLIRTDADPTLWQVGLVTMMFYSINKAVINAVVEEIRLSRGRKRRKLETRNIRRWAEQDFGGRYIEIIS